MLVAGFVMLGAKLTQRFGALNVFRAAVVVFGCAQVLMTFSPTANLMITAQALSGAAGAVIVPSLVALIAENYRGKQQATALGALGSARAGAGVLAFVIGGILGTLDRLAPRLRHPDRGLGHRSPAELPAQAGSGPARGEDRSDRRRSGGRGDHHDQFRLQQSEPLGLGARRTQCAVQHRGRVAGADPDRARHRARSGLPDVDAPATGEGKTPLLALEVIDSPKERAAVYCMFAVVALEAMLNFSVPLYIQIVQGRSPIATAIAMMPFNLTVFFAAMLIVRFYPKFTPRQIGRYGFILCTIALVWLAWVVRNDWSAVPVLFGLVVFGIGQGALVTLLFNVLVTASPKELAGDVGSLRGTTNNLAAAVGTAVAGALLVGLLSSIMLTAINASPKLTPELQAQVDLDSINFVSNDRLQETLAKTTASPAQVAEAVRVNTQSRLRALKIGLLIMAAIALLAIFPAGSLPNYQPGEIPNPSPGGRREK